MICGENKKNRIHIGKNPILYGIDYAIINEPWLIWKINYKKFKQDLFQKLINNI